MRREDVGAVLRVIGVFSVALGLVAGCAAPAPTATPTAPAVAAPTPTKAAPTPTKAPTATPTKRPVTKMEVVQSANTLVYAPSLVSKEKGYFLEEGLDVSFVVTGSGAKAVAAVIGRSALIGQAAAPDVATAIAQGQPGRVFAQLSTGFPMWMIIRKEVAEQRGITAKMTLEEKGRSVKGLTFGATSPGSATDYAPRYFLRKAGLDPDRDVTITYVGNPAAMLAAFEQGAVDVFNSALPENILPAIQQGKAVMLVDFLGGEVPGTAESFYIVALAHRDELERQPEIFEAYTRGLWRGQKLIAERVAEARDLLKSPYFPEMDPVLYEKGWGLMLPSLPKEPTLTAQRLKATLDFRNATVPPPPLEVRFEDFGTNKFVEAAKKQLGF